MLPNIIIKPGVSLKGLRTEIWIGLQICAGVLAQHGYECVITSGTEGMHSINSLHGVGLAIDMRSKHIKAAEKKLIEIEMRAALGGSGRKSEFDLILEHLGKPNEHFHLEYQPPPWPVTEGIR